MPRIDLTNVPLRTGSSYPAPHDKAMAGRSQQAIGDAGGLTQFGVNRVELAPGAMSSLRHWHEEQDEFLVVLSGKLALVDDSGQTPLGPGDCCAFPAGEANGHHIVNRGDQPGVFVAVGTRTATETAWYSDVDMKVTAADGQMHFTRADGSPLDQPEDSVADLDFATLSDTLTQALLTGDADLYARLFAVPHDVVTQQSGSYRITTRAELDDDLARYCEALRINNITDIFRIQKAITWPAPDRAIVRAEVHLMSNALRLVEPFTVVMTFGLTAAGWRIQRIESALGHINWTRGHAPLPGAGGFGQDD